MLFRGCEAIQELERDGKGPGAVTLYQRLNLLFQIYIVLDEVHA